LEGILIGSIVFQPKEAFSWIKLISKGVIENQPGIRPKRTSENKKNTDLSVFRRLFFLFLEYLILLAPRSWIKRESSPEKQAK